MLISNLTVGKQLPLHIRLPRGVLTTNTFVEDVTSVVGVVKTDIQFPAHLHNCYVALAHACTVSLGHVTLFFFFKSFKRHQPVAMIKRQQPVRLASVAGVVAAVHG